MSITSRQLISMSLLVMAAALSGCNRPAKGNDPLQYPIINFSGTWRAEAFVEAKGIKQKNCMVTYVIDDAETFSYEREVRCDGFFSKLNRVEYEKRKSDYYYDLIWNDQGLGSHYDSFITVKNPDPAQNHFDISNLDTYLQLSEFWFENGKYTLLVRADVPLEK